MDSRGRRYSGVLRLARQGGRSNEGDSGASIESLTPAKALTVGALQCVAMVPGTSRSLMTMLGGMFVGLSVEAAVEFSFCWD